MKKLLFAVVILAATMFASCNCSTSQCENQNDSTMVMDSDSLSNRFSGNY